MRQLLLIASAILCAGCIDSDQAARSYERETEFARQFILALHAGGLARVRDRVKPATLEGPWDVEAEFAKMKAALPAGPVDSMRPLDAEIEQKEGMIVTMLGYDVYGGEERARVEIWIETTRDRRYVETLNVLEMDMPAVMN